MNFNTFLFNDSEEGNQGVFNVISTKNSCFIQVYYCQDNIDSCNVFNNLTGLRKQSLVFVQSLGCKFVELRALNKHALSAHKSGHFGHSVQKLAALIVLTSDLQSETELLCILTCQDLCVIVFHPRISQKGSVPITDGVTREYQNSSTS